MLERPLSMGCKDLIWLFILRCRGVNFETFSGRTMALGKLLGYGYDEMKFIFCVRGLGVFDGERGTLGIGYGDLTRLKTRLLRNSICNR